MPELTDCVKNGEFYSEREVAPSQDCREMTQPESPFKGLVLSLYDEYTIRSKSGSRKPS
jgi:hypothetical protein